MSKRTKEDNKIEYLHHWWNVKKPKKMKSALKLSGKWWMQSFHSHKLRT